MKLLSIILIISICLGSFSFMHTMGWIDKWIGVITDTANDVIGLTGIDDAFRIQTIDNLPMTYTVNYRDEVTTLQDVVKWSATDYTKININDIEGFDYNNDIIFDTASPLLWEIALKYQVDGKTYKAYVPCIRLYKNDSQYLLLDPLNLYILGNAPRYFNVTIVFKDNYNNDFEDIVSTNILQFSGDFVGTVPVDDSYSVYTSYDYNFIVNWLNNVVFKNRTKKYYPMTIDCQILSTSYTIDDYFNGLYIYRSPIIID